MEIINFGISLNKDQFFLTFLFRGKLNIPKDIREPQLKIYNWEIGIFLPITKLNSDDDKENNIKEQGDWFSEHGIPVSYKRPPKNYDENDLPWVSKLNVKYLILLKITPI